MSLSTLQCMTTDETAFCTVEKFKHTLSFLMLKHFECVEGERSVTLSCDGGILDDSL